MRAEHEHAVAGIEKRLAEELLKDLGARPDDDVLRAGGNAELLAHERRRRLAKRRQAGRRTVVRLVLLDRLLAGRLGRRRALERAVADLELDDVLALRLECLGHGQDGERRFDVQVLRKLAECDRHRQNPFADE